MPLAGKEPSLPATMYCNIKNAVVKGVDIGIFSLSEVQYRPERFSCVNPLIGKKKLLQMETDITEYSFTKRTKRATECTKTSKCLKDN